MKLVNLLKTTIVEQNREDDDIVEIEFQTAKYTNDKYQTVFFNRLSQNPNTVSNAINIVLIDKNTRQELFFNSSDLKSTKFGDYYISMRQLRLLHPSFAHNLMDKEHKYKNESLDVRVLKTRASGIPQLILDILKDVYPNNWGKISEPNCTTLDGIIDIHPAIDGERWSILNFFDTNPGVIKILVEKYQDDVEISNLDGFKEWLIENQEDLFGENSETLKSLIKRNKQSFKSGWKTEDDAIDIIKRQNPSLTDGDIIQYCLGSIIDRVESIDASILGKTYQIKPSSKMKRLQNGSIQVETWNMNNWYKNKYPKLEYILYCNGKDIAVFPNKNYSVTNGGKTVIHYDNIVKNPFI